MEILNSKFPSQFVSKPARDCLSMDLAAMQEGYGYVEIYNCV